MRPTLLALLVLSCWPLQAQTNQPAARIVIQKVVPNYPQAAKNIGLAGTVKMFAIVAPDGRVTAVEPVGGSPLLLQAAQNAIMKWKYAPGAASKELVELHFNP